MHRISVIGSTNEVLNSVSLPENVKLEIENETVTFSSFDENTILNIKEKIATVLAAIIEQKYAKSLIDDIIGSGEYDFTDNEKETLFSNLSQKNLFGGLDLIRKKLSLFLSSAESVSVEGFANFRLNEYKKMLSDSIACYAEKIDGIRENDELIELLRLYIESRPCLEKQMNLYISKSGGYTIYSKNWIDITEKCIVNLSAADELGEMSFAEILLSSIISASPEKIVIHNEKFCKNRELINTIIKLFGEKAEICDGCSFCK